MDWKLVSLIPFCMWGFYAVFASLASNAHGEKITMGIEAIAMVIVAAALMFFGGLGDIHKVTKISLMQACAMGIMSAGGLAIQFYAFRVAPQDKQGVVVMVTCMFPVLAVVIFHVMSKLGFAGGSQCTPRQWVGVAVAVLSLWLINGK